MCTHECSLHTQGTLIRHKSTLHCTYTRYRDDVHEHFTYRNASHELSKNRICALLYNKRRFKSFNYLNAMS